MYLRRWGQVALLFSLFLSLGSCTTTDRKANGDKYSEEEVRLIVRAKKEMEIGRSMAGRLLRFYGVYEDRELVRYLNEIGNYVASQSPYSERRFMFDILNTEEVNAFACPGGYILVTLGAIRNARSEAELAAILAHEIAHVGKEHMLNKLVSMSEAEMEGKDKQEKNIPKALAVRKRPDPKKSAAGAMLAKYIGGSVAGLNALQAAKAGMSIILEKGLGAEVEFEADAMGAELAVESGYAPYALTDYLCRMHIKRGYKKEHCFAGRKPKKKAKFETILDKTHPSIPKRICPHHVEPGQDRG